MTEEDTIGETEAVMTETIDVTIEVEDHQVLELYTLISIGIDRTIILIILASMELLIPLFPHKSFYLTNLLTATLC